MKTLQYVSLFLAGLLVALGTAWAFERGANDFAVFYSAWKLVWAGKGAMLYGHTADRYLYAPGFAWIFAPLAALPEKAALLLWCLAKAAALGWIIRRFSVFGYGVASAGVVFCARPLLIDFQYGQVNVLILAAVLAALLNFLGSRRKASSPAGDFWSWFFLGAASAIKVFPAPLLTVSALRGNSRQRLGSLAGLVFVLGLPFVFLGPSAAMDLMSGWKAALLERGLPLESHNQSFLAVISHFFSGNPTHVVALSAERYYSLATWPASWIHALGLVWLALWMGLLLAWLLKGEPSYSWVALCTGLLILPSHLIWKPYFVFAIPLAIVTLSQAKEEWEKALLAVLFCALNLTGFDFVGYELAGRLEASGIFLFAHLGLVFALVIRSRQLLPSRALGSF